MREWGLIVGGWGGDCSSSSPFAVLPNREPPRRDESGADQSSLVPVISASLGITLLVLCHQNSQDVVVANHMMLKLPERMSQSCISRVCVGQDSNKMTELGQDKIGREKDQKKKRPIPMRMLCKMLLLLLLMMMMMTVMLTPPFPPQSKYPNPSPTIKTRR